MGGTEPEFCFLFFRVLEVRGPLWHFVNFKDFEAVRVKGAFYRRIAFFLN